MNTLEFRPDLSRKKFPRLFLAFREGASLPLQNITLAWPDRTTAQVLDLSDAGLLVAAQGALAKIRVGQMLEVRLCVRNRDPRPLHVKVLRISAQAILLSLDALTVGGRLRLEQEEREDLIRISWRRLPAAGGFPPSFAQAEWWHGVFDTNLWIWRDSAGALEKFVMEFESIALIYETQGVRFVKSPSAFEEGKGYVGPMTDPLPNKVEAGHGWTHRLGKSLDSSPLPSAVWLELKNYLPNGKQLNV